jgi:hypothetical protein
MFQTSLTWVRFRGNHEDHEYSADDARHDTGVIMVMLMMLMMIMMSMIVTSSVFDVITET